MIVEAGCVSSKIQTVPLLLAAFLDTLETSRQDRMERAFSRSVYRGDTLLSISLFLPQDPGGLHGKGQGPVSLVNWLAISQL